MSPLFRKTLYVILGGFIQGLGMGLFLFPHAIPSGGAGGITVLLNYWFSISMGMALWIVNFVLLLFGVRILGKRFALWTVVSITITSLSVDFFEKNFIIPDRILLYDLVFGSIFLGVGIGLLMRNGVSNGGIGVVALVIATKRHILPGKPLFFINILIFFVTALIIDWKIMFLAFVSQWISTRVVDIICSIKLYHTYTLGWRKKT